MKYEIINPSDKCFITSDDERLAEIVCVMLGNGSYGLKDENGNTVLCVLEPLDQGKVLCRFKRPVRAVTPGQAVVFYQNGYVAGGGIIIGKTEDTGNLV